MIKKEVYLLYFLVLFSWYANAQDAVVGIPPNIMESYSDTIIVNSEHYRLLHYHEVSKDIEINKLYSSHSDEIFTDTFNKFSRLVFKDRDKSFDIPTVPLTHLYILANKKLILGLASFTRLPYNIVLYSFNGDILYKGQINFRELKLTREQIKKMIKKYPDFKTCLEHKPNVFKQGEEYHIEITRCISNTVSVDTLVSLGLISGNSYFKRVSIGTHQTYKDGKYNYQQYTTCFDKSDPLYDLIMIGNVPYLLILNETNGNKIYIPLVSNCDILKDIED